MAASLPTGLELARRDGGDLFDHGRAYLTIPPSQGLWCAGDHNHHFGCRASRSGNFSGPVGGTLGQRPYRDGVPSMSSSRPSGAGRPGLPRDPCPRCGHPSVDGRFLAGRYRGPAQRSAEICIGEMFGDGVVQGVSTAVGVGLHAFRGSSVTEDFEAVPPHRRGRLSHLRSGLDGRQGRLPR